MPLKPGSSRDVISENIRNEMAAGRKQDQAVAIALKMARKYADGGEVSDKIPFDTAVTAREPSWREQLADWIMGQNASPERRRFATNLTGSQDASFPIVNYTPVAPAVDAVDNATQGNYRKAALNAAETASSFVPYSYIAGKLSKMFSRPAAEAVEAVAPAVAKRPDSWLDAERLAAKESAALQLPYRLPPVASKTEEFVAKNAPSWDWLKLQYRIEELNRSVPALIREQSRSPEASKKLSDTLREMSRLRDEAQAIGPTIGELQHIANRTRTPGRIISSTPEPPIPMSAYRARANVANDFNRGGAVGAALNLARKSYALGGATDMVDAPMSQGAPAPDYSMINPPQPDQPMSPPPQAQMGGMSPPPPAPMPMPMAPPPAPAPQPDVTPLQLVSKAMDLLAKAPDKILGAFMPKPPKPAEAPMAPMPEGGFAKGGDVKPPWYQISESRNLMRQGALHSPVPGRTDALPVTAKKGAYVVPADVVSGLGQGNTMAGTKTLEAMFKTGPYGTTMPKMRRPSLPTGNRRNRGFAEGGEIPMGDDSGVDIMAAGGEFIVPPESVAEIGGGDIQHGHDILDAFVQKVRGDTIATMQQLPGPK